MTKYLPKKFEKKWQDFWEKSKIYKADNNSKRPKKYILDMFPYPSGDGMHVGHIKGYLATDIISRFYRFNGFNVLHPMGWDAFGLPAENYAIKMGIHPRITTAKNISNIKRQMKDAALSYDWSREIDTTDPEYYKWTQWIFIKLFEHGLAYEDEAPINFCPVDKTGLANEEVVNGMCERCGAEVVRKVIRQWILRITKYADRLLEGLEGLDWPRPIKDMQINWIGRKEGINITYQIEGSEETVSCFTTRPDTNFGATFVVIAPENPIIREITKEDHSKKVQDYVSKALNKQEEERIAQGRAKTGVFTGSYAINHLSGRKMPIWVSDFVLGSVGTGAVVGVPGHDLRDFQFAKEFNLPVIRVVVGKDGDKSEIEKAEQVQEEEGIIINSDFLDGLDIHEATKVVMDYIEAKGWGKRVVNYHLRDWIFSRQRYWGEPIPIIHCDKCGLVSVPEGDLPVKLPNVEKYEPSGTGQSPLVNIESWVNVKCPKCGGKAKRETNTMPQWAGSCWYYLRFCDTKNDQALISQQADKYWMPVDWYVGGAEHAVLHLLYARFWHKFLFDIGAVYTSEPFQKLTNVGIVLAPDGKRMSKSRGNVITPDEIIEPYGADTLRVYEAFMGPFENSISWNPTSINGVYKFLNRVWEMILKENGQSAEKTVQARLNKLVNKVSSDIIKLKFNTAISSMMEFINLSESKSLTQEQKKKFLIVLSPFAPHITEELWEKIGQKPSIHTESWPELLETLPRDEEEFNLPVQINGKIRDSLKISYKLIDDKDKIEQLVMDREKIKKHLNNQKVKQVIYVKEKIFSIVV